MELLTSRDLEQLLPLLRETDEDPARIEGAITDPANTAYLFSADGVMVGAAVMRWHPQESELLYIQVEREYRGKGYGRAAVALLLAAAQAQGVESVVVGTANTSLENIAFYQKCGFRMDAVRKDFFDYFPAPVYEHGIQMRDMLMFRWQPGS